MSEDNIELTGSLTPEGVQFTSEIIAVYAIQICTNGNEPLVSIKMDGTIEYGVGYTPDGAAKVFWEALADWPKRVTEIQERVECVEQDFARLDSKYGNNWTEWADVRESIRRLKAAIR